MAPSPTLLPLCFAGGGDSGVPPTIFGVKSAADHFAVLVNRQLWATTNDPDVYLGHHFCG